MSLLLLSFLNHLTQKKKLKSSGKPEINDVSPDVFVQPPKTVQWSDKKPMHCLQICNNKLWGQGMPSLFSISAFPNYILD